MIAGILLILVLGLAFFLFHLMSESKLEAVVPKANPPKTNAFLDGARSPAPGALLSLPRSADKESSAAIATPSVEVSRKPSVELPSMPSKFNTFHRGESDRFRRSESNAFRRSDSDAFQRSESDAFQRSESNAFQRSEFNAFARGECDTFRTKNSHFATNAFRGLCSAAA